ncbi:MAG: hypothetical protein ACFFGZ_16580 [Candidatus Thorarchaeota archaeon]
MASRTVLAAALIVIAGGLILGGLLTAELLNFTLFQESKESSDLKISEIPNQDAIVGHPFTLDLSPYISIPEESNNNFLDGQVITGGGLLSGFIYQNLFDTAGNETVSFKMRLSGHDWIFGAFLVKVSPDYEGNNPPLLTPIPKDKTVLHVSYILNIGPYASDDYDEDSELQFEIISGPGSFLSSIYYHNFSTVGNHTILFSVTDSLGASTEGNFSVEVFPNYLEMIASTSILISDIPPQRTIVGQEFSFDLTSFLTVPENITEESITIEVITGGGTMSGFVYQNTFTTVGYVSVIFRVQALNGTLSHGVFMVEVLPDYVGNNAPIISSIPSHKTIQHAMFLIDLGPFVSDDYDADDQLLFETVSGGGLFVESIYYHNFTSSDNYTIIFSVTDTLGATTEGNFSVEVLASAAPEDPLILVSEIPLQHAFTGTPFDLNLSSYLLIPESVDAALLTLEVVTGGGTITEQVDGFFYGEIFSGMGNVSVSFRVRVQNGNWTYGVFVVEVVPDFPGNTAPTIGSIPDCECVEGLRVFLDLSPYVSDDYDADSNLSFVIHSGAGELTGSIYSHTYATSGTYKVFFNVSDTVEEVSQGNFTIVVLPAYLSTPVFPDNAIYVSSYGTDSVDAGTKASPCKTLSYGITRAVALNNDCIVLGQGLYNESITLANGISIFGGYSPSFQWYSLEFLQASILQLPAASFKTVTANSIDLPTVVEGLKIYGPEVTQAGTTSYAVYFKDCNGSLVIRNCTIVGGRGGNGLSGTLGNDGVYGPDGSAGTAPIEDQGTDNYGGPGGTRIVDGTDVSGGAGGTAVTPSYDSQQNSGANGKGVGGGGAGGAGGWDEESSSTGSIIIPTHGPWNGEAGNNGANGNDGAGGGGGSSGTIVGGFWESASGTDGMDGMHGNGGGGGGAGGGIEDSGSYYGYDVLGGSGGGGGAGGGRGEHGTHGSGGGGSFALFLYFSTPPTSIPIIGNNTVYLGSGGRGGAGGSGGTGGSGGLGGTGGLADGHPSGWPYSGAGNGGNGGLGGRGGHGGGGGGGAGGCSYGIYVAGYSGTPDYGSKNLFISSTGHGGAGGPGGYSLGYFGSSGATGIVAAYNF